MNKQKKGIFITLEGGEATGKSTAASVLKERFEKNGFEVLVTREPGGIPSAEAIRDTIMNFEIDARTELMLFLAARREHLVNKIIPALNEGKIVITDRFFISSLVYQGYARGLGIDEVRNLNAYVCEGVFPDLNIIIDVPAEVSLTRKSGEDLEVNRLDLEGVAFHRKVSEGYRLIAAQGIDPVVVVDGTVSLEALFDRLEAEILKVL